jgi:hypothetical protein
MDRPGEPRPTTMERVQEIEPRFSAWETRTHPLRMPWSECVCLVDGQNKIFYECPCVALSQRSRVGRRPPVGQAATGVLSGLRSLLGGWSEFGVDVVGYEQRYE